MTNRVVLYGITLSVIIFNISAGSNVGGVIGGSILGSFIGSTVSNVITQPRQQTQPTVVERTVFVQQPTVQQQNRYVESYQENRKQSGSYYNSNGAATHSNDTKPARTRRELEEENARLRAELNRVHQ